MSSTLGPEVLFHVSSFNVTNTFIVTLLVDFLLLFLVYKATRKMSLYPGRLQNIMETVVETFYSFTEQIAGERAKSIFPWFITFFIFIFASNLAGLLPGFGTIGITEGGHKLVPLFRASTSDFNTTFALAVVSLCATHVLSIRYSGVLHYFQRFFSFNPILLFVGMLEIVSELTKLFSLSFRLFGNIYAGEVVLGTVSSIFAFLAPVPFLMLEGLVALVQALVFSILTMVFMSILTTPHLQGGEH